MAEVVAIVGMANAGFKLAITLFSFAEAIGSADKEIVRTAKDISAFSDVLTCLVDTLERGQDAKYISKSAFETIRSVINECKEVFGEVDAMIQKSTRSEEVIKMKGDEMVPVMGAKLSVPLAKRFLYLFQKSKLEALRRSLESLKTTLGVLLGALAIAEKFEKMTSNPACAAESEASKALRAMEQLKMECLLQANEVAAAEVRKHLKSTTKKTTEKDEKESSSAQPRPSIASAGVLRELPKQPPPAYTEAPQSKPVSQTSSNENCLAPVWIQTSLPDGARKPDPNESQIPVKDTGQVVNALLALWLLNLAGRNDPPNEVPTEGNQKSGTKQKVGDGEKSVDLFPKRAPRPYSVRTHKNVSVEEAEEEPIDLFPRRAPRPY